MAFQAFDRDDALRVSDCLQGLIGTQDNQGQGGVMDCAQALSAQGLTVWLNSQPETDLACPLLPDFFGHAHEDG